MRKVALFTFLILVSLPALAEILSCDVLKARVDAKLQEKGVPSYTLEVLRIENASNPAVIASAGVPATKAPESKEVGTCEGGTKRIMYTKGN